MYHVAISAPPYLGWLSFLHDGGFVMRQLYLSVMTFFASVISFDSPFVDKIRRMLLYQGRLFVFSPRESTLALCELADRLIREAFGKLSPRQAQYSLPVEEYAAILADMTCDLEKTYFDVPRMRSSTSDNYLTTGIAYAWHPHRDTWYSAPMCQLNWWIPIYDIDADDGVAFHPQYWD